MRRVRHQFESDHMTLLAAGYMQMTRAQVEAWSEEVNTILGNEYTGGGGDVRDVASALVQARRCSETRGVQTDLCAPSHNSECGVPSAPSCRQGRAPDVAINVIAPAAASDVLERSPSGHSTCCCAQALVLRAGAAGVAALSEALQIRLAEADALWVRSRSSLGTCAFPMLDSASLDVPRTTLEAHIVVLVLIGIVVPVLGKSAHPLGCGDRLAIKLCEPLAATVGCWLAFRGVCGARAGGQQRVVVARAGGGAAGGGRHAGDAVGGARR